MPTGEEPSASARAGRFFPPWNSDSLPDPPRLTLRSWTLLIGPGLLMAGSNIGGGEWLFGPIVTARYGGSLMWLATLSIAFQVFYNLSVMRYTLYTGARPALLDVLLPARRSRRDLALFGFERRRPIGRRFPGTPPRARRGRPAAHG